MAKDVIANILHRDTIATIVGARTFERGERVLEEGRVLGVESTRGQLKGTVRPSEPGRPYAARIWIREDGVAYECTCPHGSTGAFCKHAVAIALFYVEKERKTLESQIGALRDRLMSMPHPSLVDSLIEQGRADPHLLLALAGLAVRELQ
jgi:uncharacterized Zn finger protein